MVKGVEDLQVDEDQMTEYRFQVIFSLEEEEAKQLGINLAEEAKKEEAYKKFKEE